jgi:hypothetical protein
MVGCYGALQTETFPFEMSHSVVEQPVQSCLEAGGICTVPRKRFEPVKSAVPQQVRTRLIRQLHFDHRVIELLAIAAEDGLDKQIQAAVSPARNLGPITATRAFIPVGAAHAFSANDEPEIPIFPAGAQARS